LRIWPKSVTAYADRHAEMQKVGNNRAGFLATMLRRGGGKGSADSAVFAAHPNAAGLIPEVCYLVRHPPSMCRCRHDDSVTPFTTDGDFRLGRA
jgi:hypothetical protein